MPPAARRHRGPAARRRRPGPRSTCCAGPGRWPSRPACTSSPAARSTRATARRRPPGRAAGRAVGRLAGLRRAAGPGAGLRRGPRDLRGVRGAARGPDARRDASSPTRPATTSSATGWALLDRSVSLAGMLSRRGLVLRSDLLRPWAHWITPEFEPKRFDTRFFVAAVPTGQRPRDVSGEADDTVWLPVAEAVARARRRRAGDAAAHDRGAARARRPTRRSPRCSRRPARSGRCCRGWSTATATGCGSQAGATRDGGCAAGLGRAGPGRQPGPDDARGHQHLRAARGGADGHAGASWSTRARWTRRTSQPWSPPPTGTWASCCSPTATRTTPTVPSLLQEMTGAPMAAADPRFCVGAEPLRGRHAARRGRRARRARAGDAGAHRRLGQLPGAPATSRACSPATPSSAAAPRWSPTPTAGWPTTSGRWRAIRDLPGPLTLLPGHGPAGGDAGERAAAYLAHRAERLDQVRAALAAGDTTPQQVVRRVYADVDESLWPAAELSVRAQLDYLAATERPPDRSPQDRSRRWWPTAGALGASSRK